MTILKIVIAILINVIIIRVLMNVFNTGGIDWVGFWEALWEKRRI